MATTSQGLLRSPRSTPLAAHALANDAEEFDLETYLAQERSKDLLRFSTAGSVDDGKSTLIGRLLYDTQNVYDDQVLSIAGRGSAGEGQLDLALLTDGLRAEREQGITIDVAYRYFATKRRKFIIADTPGHEQYTRNMATGASTADVAIVLVDVRKGVLVQSRRHAYIAALLGVPHLIVAINKMDLVSYSEESYSRIRGHFTDFFAGLEEHGSSTLHFVPVSALSGDNVAQPSGHMLWYQGPTLLDLLETIPSTDRAVSAPFRFVVQRVLRTAQDFRGFAGHIAAGTVRPGDAVQLLPSGRHSTVRAIVTYDGDLPEASAPLSVCLTLEDEIDVSRGDMLVTPGQPATLARRFTASLVWMDAQSLVVGRRYLLKHTSRTVHATVRAIRYSVDVTDLQRCDATTLAMNGIGLVEIETAQPLTLDLYATNRYTGSFVLIDTETNGTVAAGMVRALLSDVLSATPTGPVTPKERARLWGHTGAHLALNGTADFADAVERGLLEGGMVVFRCELKDIRLREAIIAGGGLALTLALVTSGRHEARIGQYEAVIVAYTPSDHASAVNAVLALLQQANVLQAPAVTSRGGNDSGGSR